MSCRRTRVAHLVRILGIAPPLIFPLLSLSGMCTEDAPLHGADFSCPYTLRNGYPNTSKVPDYDGADTRH